MSRVFKTLCVLLTASITLTAAEEQPAVAAGEAAARSTRGAPTRPDAQNGVDYFRLLLSLPTAEREQELARKSATQRTVFLKALQEYEILSPDDREVRLQTLELRVHLYRLIRTPQRSRDEGLSRVPDRVKPAVSKRLGEWDRLDASLQKQLLSNKAALLYFTRGTPSTVQVASLAPVGSYEQFDQHLSEWRGLSKSARQALASQFQQFFELDEDERRKALKHLPEKERKDLLRSLQLFNRLPATQRVTIIQSFDRLAHLPEKERNQFLRNVSLWADMTPNDRQAWRSLIDEFPPMPPDVPMPPPLPSLPKKSQLEIELPPFPGQ